MLLKKELSAQYQQAPGSNFFWKSSNHSFEKYLPLLAPPRPVLAFDGTRAGAFGDFAERYHHGVGGVCPAQVRLVLEVEFPAFQGAGLRLEHLGPLVERLFAVALEVRCVKAQQPVHVALGLGVAPGIEHRVERLAVRLHGVGRYPLQLARWPRLWSRGFG